MSILYRPMKKWPDDIKIERLRAPFKADYRSTVNLLDREVRMIRGIDAVVELALKDGAFNRDGIPYADATPEHPGIIVRIRKPVRNPRGQMDMVPLYFPAARFTPYHANIRAVAIALEDLRRIDRYGVTQNSQQYLGFGKYLPSPTHTGVLTLEAAARFVAGVGATNGECASLASNIIDSAIVWRDAYRDATTKLHPDKNGDPEKWEMLQAAKTLLDDHHNPK
jgi:hypothetical protein